MVNAICYCNTVNDYNNVSNALDKICECHNITNWLEWWKERKYHIVPAYREFCLSGLNLAETRQSAIKRDRPMWLSVATWRDICYYIVQDRAYKGFLSNQTRLSAFQPTQLARENKRKRVDNNFIKAYKAVYEDPDADFEAELQLEDAEEKYFLPNKWSRQRVMENDDAPPPKRRKRTCYSSISKEEWHSRN